MSNVGWSIKKKVSDAFQYVFLGVFLLGSLVAPVAARGNAKGAVKAAQSNWSQAGRWEPSFSSAPLIHATVLPNGNVLHWTSFANHAYTRLWDCVLDPVTGLCDPDISGNNRHDVWYTDKDVYCSGHSLMSDGRVMITGGTLFGQAYDGDPGTTIFDYQTPIYPTVKAFKPGPNMANGRWYPSNVALGSGGTLTAAGTYCAQRGIIGNQCAQVANNLYPEILPSSTATAWDKLDNAQMLLPLYPWLYYASNGKVFYAGQEAQSRWLDLQGEGAWSLGPVSSAYRESGSSVMYDTDKIMISGGGPVTPLATAEIIDLTPSAAPSPTPPAWQFTAPMANPRKHHNLTILADGTVLATGGTKGNGFNNNCPENVVYAAERWNPANGTWSTMASMAQNRRYHSTAMLLPDGRVLSAGSAEYPSAGDTCPVLPNQYQTEIYTPPYLFNPDGTYATRPTISNAPSTMGYGQQILINMPNTSSIAKVTMVRLSSVTHSINMNQRINNLTFRRVGAGLRVTTPASGNVCPPGHYMMFVVNNAGVPSVAKIVQIQ